MARMTKSQSGPYALTRAFRTILEYHRATLTATQLAQAIGCKPQTISAYRNGDREGQIWIWDLICRRLGFRLDEFFRFAWDLDRGVPVPAALETLYADNPSTDARFLRRSDYDEEMDRILSAIKRWWQSQAHVEDQDSRDTALSFFAAFCVAFPDFAAWYGQRPSLKNPAECGA